MKKLVQELRFLVGPGNNSTSRHSDRNIDSNVIEMNKSYNRNSK